jgi:hypothetical protein
VLDPVAVGRRPRPLDAAATRRVRPGSRSSEISGRSTCDRAVSWVQTGPCRPAGDVRHDPSGRVGRRTRPSASSPAGGRAACDARRRAGRRSAGPGSRRRGRSPRGAWAPHRPVRRPARVGRAGRARPRVQHLREQAWDGLRDDSSRRPHPARRRPVQGATGPGPGERLHPIRPAPGARVGGATPNRGIGMGRCRMVSPRPGEDQQARPDHGRNGYRRCSDYRLSQARQARRSRPAVARSW